MHARGLPKHAEVTEQDGKLFMELIRNHCCRKMSDLALKHHTQRWLENHLNDVDYFKFYKQAYWDQITYLEGLLKENNIAFEYGKEDPR